ncbi:MAG TPA: LexA family transcriptional regulator [Phenylobacterium sp.]
MPPQEQAAALGKALKALRERAGMTQEAAAEALGVTRQAWQNYEAGGRNTILRTDLQERLASALGLERSDLLRERDRQAGVPTGARTPANEDYDTPAAYELQVLGRVKASPAGPLIYDIAEPESVVDVSWMFGANARTLRVAGDSMTGYVESGQLVIYDVSMWPRRGDGCVVELANGEVYVKEYLDQGQGVLRVRQRFPEEILSFPMADVRGVYLIRFRGS